MSRRITNHVRDSIVRSLLERAFSEKEQALKNKGANLFARYVAHTWGDAFDVVQTLNSELFNTAISVCVHTRNTSRHLEGHYTCVVPNNYSHYLYENDVKNFTSAVDPTLGDDLRAWVKSAETLEKERKRAEAEIESVVYSTSSFKKLFEIWPELRTVPTVVALSAEEPGGHQLASNLPSLNKVLGLPVEALETA